MAGRAWTSAELRRLKRAVSGKLSDQIDWPAIAARLGHSEAACRSQAHRRNLYLVDSHCAYDDEFIAFLRRHHALGWSDDDIAMAWGGERRAVGRHRRRLGLRSNQYNGRHQAKLARTWFKRGELHGQALRNYSALGAISIRRRDCAGRRECRRWIKVRDDGPYQARWIPLARLIWEQTHGPVPPGMFVVHRDGDGLNDDWRNLMLISRREVPAWQRRVRPRMEARRRAGLARANRQRWADYRAVQAARRSTRRAAACTA
jgi:hypothetical protein